MQTLKDEDLYDCTTILFMSDHGYSLGEHAMWNKNTNYENSAQIPIIISHPG